MNKLIHDIISFYGPINKINSDPILIEPLIDYDEDSQYHTMESLYKNVSEILPMRRSDYTYTVDGIDPTDHIYIKRKVNYID